jgi:carbon storage regulator
VLVFTRKRGEAIVIGDGIEIRVLRVGRDGVRLGVTAPAEVAVHRHEIYEMVVAANLSASQAAAPDLEGMAARLRRRGTAEPELVKRGSA